MRRTVTAMEARRRLGELLEGVYYRGDEVTIERAGKVMGVVVSESEYAEFAAAKRKMHMDRFMDAIHRIHDANPDLQELSEDELQAFIDTGVLPARVQQPALTAR